MENQNPKKKGTPKHDVPKLNVKNVVVFTKYREQTEAESQNLISGWNALGREKRGY